MFERHRKKQKQRSLSEELGELIKIPSNPFNEWDIKKIRKKL